MKSEIAIIVLNYNAYAPAIKNVDCIIDLNQGCDIIVVDNCSTDNSYEELKNHYNSNDRVMVIKSEYNGGYSYGNNCGMKFAIHNNSDLKYLAIRNPDSYCPQANMVRELCNLLEEDQNIALIEPLMIEPCGRGMVYKRFQNGWKIPDWKILTLQRLPLVRKIFRWKDRYKQMEVSKNGKLAYVQVVHGSFFMAKKEVLEKIGFLDEKVFLYYEENILAYKIAKLGMTEAISLTHSYIHEHDRKNESLEKILRSEKIMSDSMFHFASQYLMISGIKMKVLKIVDVIYRRIIVPYSYRRNGL